MTVPDVVRDRPTTLDFWGIHPTVVTNWRRLRIEQPLSDNIDYVAEIGSVTGFKAPWYTPCWDFLR